MDLPNLLSKIKSSDDTVKQFIAIEIASNAVKTAIWQVKKQHTEIVSVGSIQIWDTKTDEDLLAAIDTSLSEALAGIESEPDEVIFGLPETWVGPDDIAENKKATLKRVCTKLAVKPVGFVVTTEAVVHYLQDTEGGPPSAILVRVEAEQVVVSLVQLGKLEGVQVVGRSPEIGADVEEGLARFPEIENLPTRIILYDSKEDLEAMKQDLISHDWLDKLSFLHFPQIEILPKDGTINAVALSGGAEVAKSLGLALTKKKVTGTDTDKKAEDQVSERKQSDTANEVANVDEEDGAEETNLPPDKSADFGFAPIEVGGAETAVSRKDEIETTEEVEVGEKEMKKTAADMEPELVPVDSAEVFTPSKEEEKEENVKDEKVEKKKRGLPKLKLSLPFKRKAKVNSWAKKPRLPRMRLPTMLLVGVVVLVLFIGGGTYYYWTVPEAEVKIYLKPESMDREISFSLDPSATEVDLENNIIPGSQETVEVNGNQQTPTTGSVTVGERANGQVEIFNRTLSSKTLPSGAVIKKDSLRYTLDEDVTIASASSQENADFSITRKPSSQKAAVTAADIGDQYNLTSGTQFTVANFSNEDFVAKAVASFSGGSAEEIQAVSAEDIDRLRTELAAKLTQQISQEVSQKSDGQQGIIPASDPEIIDEELSADEGEEAQNVSLATSLAQSIFIYNLKDISMLGQQQVMGNVPSGFTVIPTATQVEVSKSELSDDDTVNITAKVSLKLLPQINMDEIVQNIQGKYPQDAEDYLRSLPNYVKTEVSISPSLPSRLNTFPRLNENIHLVVGTQDG